MALPIRLETLDFGWLDDGNFVSERIAKLAAFKLGLKRIRKPWIDKIDECNASADAGVHSKGPQGNMGEVVGVLEPSLIYLC